MNAPQPHSSLLSFILSRVRGVFYGWWIVLSASVMQSLNQGLLNQGFGVYFLPLQSEFGWSKTLLSLGYSVGQVESGLLAPVVGWLTDRVGPRRVVTIGIVLFGAGLMLLSSINSVAMFFATFLLVAVGSSLSGFLPCSVAVLNWFVRRRTLALGISMAGSGIAAAIVPTVAWSVTNFGWRPAALFSGFVVWAVGIPMALLLRQRPEKYGYLPDGDRPDSASPVASFANAPKSIPTGTSLDEGFTVKEALGTRSFWFIAFGHMSAVFTVSAVSLHLVPDLVQSMGMSLQSAGAIASMVLVISVVGRILGGWLADRTNKRAVLVASMLAHAIGLLTLAYATTMLQVFIFATLHGLAWGARAPTQNAIRAEYFGRKSIGVILGVGIVVVSIASTTAPIFAGWLADARGNYQLAFTVVAVLTALGSLFFAFASKPARARPKSDAASG